MSEWELLEALRLKYALKEGDRGERPALFDIPPTRATGSKLCRKERAETVNGILLCRILKARGAATLARDCCEAGDNNLHDLLFRTQPQVLRGDYYRDDPFCYSSLRSANSVD